MLIKIMAGVALFFLAYFIFLKATNKRRRARKREKDLEKRGRDGESRVTAELKKLGREYTVFPDVCFAGDGTKERIHHQVDQIVVSPYGIFVVETKNFNNCQIRKKDDDKFISTRAGSPDRLFHNPVTQNANHVKGLERVLDDVNFISVVVFAGNAALEGLKGNDKLFVGQMSSMNRFIKSFKSPRYSRKQLKEINQKIRAINIKSRKLRRQFTRRIEVKYQA